MDKSDVIFSYKGPVTQDILVAVGDSIKEKFRSNDVGNTVVKKIFAIFIEEAQNVLKYSFDKLSFIFDELVKKDLIDKKKVACRLHKNNKD